MRAPRCTVRFQASVTAAPMTKTGSKSAAGPGISRQGIHRRRGIGAVVLVSTAVESPFDRFALLCGAESIKCRLWPNGFVQRDEVSQSRVDIPAEETCPSRLQRRLGWGSCVDVTSEENLHIVVGGKTRHQRF